MSGAWVAERGVPFVSVEDLGFPLIISVLLLPAETEGLSGLLSAHSLPFGSWNA